MDDGISMSMSADSLSDETLNQGPLALLIRRQYEFSFWINRMQFSIFNFFFNAQFAPSRTQLELLPCNRLFDLCYIKPKGGGWLVNFSR